jgi:hypothetical protein
METYIQWAKQNPEVVIAIVTYVIINLAPRKHPDQATGWQKYLWLLLDRVSLLTHDKVPGKLKWILVASPLDKPAPSDKDAEKDGDADGKE